jgi:hypothetical protein
MQCSQRVCHDRAFVAAQRALLPISPHRSLSPYGRELGTLAMHICALPYATSRDTIVTFSSPSEKLAHITQIQSDGRMFWQSFL